MKTITLEDFNGNKDNYYNFKNHIELAKKALHTASLYVLDYSPKFFDALDEAIEDLETINFEN